MNTSGARGDERSTLSEYKAARGGGGSGGALPTFFEILHFKTLRMPYFASVKEFFAYMTFIRAGHKKFLRNTEGKKIKLYSRYMYVKV